MGISTRCSSLVPLITKKRLQLKIFGPDTPEPADWEETAREVRGNARQHQEALDQVNDYNIPYGEPFTMSKRFLF